MTWKISIQGQVQGVGFRPFVWRAALEQNLKGWVANGRQGVVIKVNGTPQQALHFQQYILKNAPELSRITNHCMEHDQDVCFESFTIAESEEDGLPLLLLTPDVALCAECQHEIHNPANRRYRYLFTTCTICGPRYSILSKLPYDRFSTTMQAFEMCAACCAEYESPDDRRYFVQTNSCAECGIQLSWFDSRVFQRDLYPDNETIIQKTLAAWQSGAIVAIKGLSGYLLTCDATNAVSVATLRARKQRPSKPFALMYSHIALLQKDAVVPKNALQQLQNPAAPIVLLDLLENVASGLDCAGIAPGLHKIGAMLPNAPLLDILLHDFGRPIVATSGNVSNTPLIYQDEVAINELSGIADYILLHNRDIIMPQDDSVVALCKNDSANTVWLRRARGLAPTFIQQGLPVPQETVLALGAEMKSTFTLAHAGNLHISPYLGDLSDFGVQERFEYALHHLLGLFGAQPAVIVGDLHPGYFATQLGEALAEKWQVPFRRVQHHEAHFAAVLAENNLLYTTEENILGVIWDGTGYGRDGQIWGGEFFLYSSHSDMRRYAHFEYFPQLLGDKMSLEPRLSALAACFDLSANHYLQPQFSITEWGLYQKMCVQPNLLETSSVGRIFDAVASLLGMVNKVTYEGEAAQSLEDAARQYCNRHGFDFDSYYLKASVLSAPTLLIKTKILFQEIIADLNAGKARDYIAAKFHYSMVIIIKKTSDQLNLHKIAFSGGVFQNTLLLDMIQYHLALDYQLYFHKQLSPNDENISLGQIFRGKCLDVE